MHRSLSAGLLLLSFLCASCATPVQSPHSQQLMVYTGPGCQGRKALTGFETFLGRKPDGVLTGMEYKSWALQMASLRYGQRCWRGAPYRIVLWVPMLVNGATLKAGARGDYDAHFHDIADLLMKEGRGDAYLRIGHEFNGGWYPWAASRDPEAWKAYFRRIVKIFRETPNAHFQVVWNPALGVLKLAPDKAYPGDDVVDVVGVDFYNRKTGPGDATAEGRWKRYRTQPYGLDWLVAFAHEHKKRIAVPEWGTGTDNHGGAGDDPAFIRNMAGWLRENDVLFHGYWDYGTGYNSRISRGQFPESAAAFKDVFGAPARNDASPSREPQPSSF